MIVEFIILSFWNLFGLIGGGIVLVLVGLVGNEDFFVYLIVFVLVCVVGW